MEYQNHEESIFSLEVSPIMRSDLIEAAKWGKFLAVLGFIGTGLMLLLGFFSILFSDTMGSAFGGNIFSGIIGYVFYFGFVALYFYPAFAMFKFCTLTRDGLLFNNQDLFEEGISYLKRLLRYMGILTIVILSLYLLLIFFLIIARTA